MDIVNIFYQAVFYSFLSLFSIINPIGMASVFLSLTKDFKPEEKVILAKKVFKYGVLLLITTFCLGSYILNIFGISLYALQIAGGLIIFSSSWQLLNSKNENNILKVEHYKQIAFYPLTMPITTGAGAISVTIALAANANSIVSKINSYTTYFGYIVGMGAIMLFTFFCYKYSDLINKKLGNNGVTIVTKITAFLLIAIGVGMVCSGIKVFLKTL